MKFAVLLLLLLTLAGCRASYDWVAIPVVAPSGKQGCAIECIHQFDCWRLAGTHCPNGYTFVDSQTSKEFTMAGNTSFVAAKTRGRYSMLVECR